MVSGEGRDDSLSGCFWRLPAGRLIGTAGREATGTDYLQGFLMGPVSGTCPPMWLNVVILALGTVMFHGGRCPAGGVVEKVEKKRKCCFIVFCKCYKTPNGSKKKKENKSDTSVGTALLEALAGQFIYFSESNVRPRLIQRARIGGPGRG